MSILYYVRGENGIQQPVYSLDDDTLGRGVRKTYYEICMETAADGQSCDYVKYAQPGGPYVFPDGRVDYASYLRDAWGITSGKNFEQWGSALYKVGNFYINKLFDENRRVILQQVLPDKQSPFEQFVKIGMTIAAVSALGPLAGQLGSSIVGPQLAAQYPALASAVGNTFLQTAINGGDIGKAVTSVATGYIGGQVGGFVQGVSDSQIIGKIAAGATGAVINGGNILPAIAGPIISSVANDVVSSLSTPSAGSTMDYGFGDDGYTFDDSFDLDTPDFSGTAGPVFMPTDVYSGMDSFDSFDSGNLDDLSFSSDGNFGGADYVYTFGDSSSNYHDPVYDADPDYTPIFGGVTPQLPSDFPGGSGEISIPDPSIYLPDYQVTGGSNIPTTQGGTDWGAALAKLGTMALQIYQQQRSPAIKSATTSVRLPDGSIQVVNRNGTVTTRSPNGQTTTTQLPPGQPYRFPDGSIVMNNGNGSYTEQNMAGQVSTRQYGNVGGVGGIGGVSLPILAGGALLVFLALKK